MGERNQGEEGTNADFHPVPARVFEGEPLAIDDAIRARYQGRSPVVRPDLRYVAIPFGRRALATAIRSADSAREEAPPRSDWEGQWERMIDTGNKASKALSE